MTTPRMTVREVVLDSVVERAIATTAQMFGLSQAAVATIVLVGLPMMAKQAAFNPELFKRMYAATRVTLPEPVLEYYVRMALNPSLRQSAVDDYKATYGTMLDAVHREAARQAGITDGQARVVMATILPALNQALVRAHSLDDQQSFARQLGTLSGTCAAAP
jgi:hypothetical protein